MTSRTRPRTRFTRPVLAALFAVGFLGALASLSSCTPEDQPREQNEALRVENRTRLVAAMSWEESDLDTRTILCESIAAFGPDWAADQVVQGMSPATLADIDPRISVDFVTERCVQENLWPVWATSFPYPGDS